MISIPPKCFEPKSRWAYILPDLDCARADALCFEFNLRHDPAFIARWHDTEKGVALMVASTLDQAGLDTLMLRELRPLLSTPRLIL